MATKKAKSRSIDFTNVKERGAYNPRHVEAGDYVATITSCVDQESKNGDDMWVYGFQLKDHASHIYPYYCVLNEDNAWKVRNVFEAAGITVPKKMVKVDPNRVVGKDVLISLEDDEYEGKPKSVIAALMPVSELDVVDDDDEDEDDAPPARKKKPAAKGKRALAVVEDDDEDEEDDEPPAKVPAKKKRRPAPVEDDDEEEDDEEPPARTKKAAGKKRRPPVVEDDDEEEDDEEEAPPTKTRAKKGTKRKAAKPVEDDDYDEMDVEDL